MRVDEWQVRFDSALDSNRMGFFRFVVRRRAGDQIEVLCPDGVVHEVNNGTILPPDHLWQLPEDIMVSFLNELWSRGIRPSMPSVDTENTLLRERVEYLKGLADQLLSRALRAPAKFED